VTLNIACRLGRHRPSRRWQLDLLDQQVKSYCRGCGAVIVRSGEGIKVQEPSFRSRPKAGQRSRALVLCGALSLFAAAAVLGLWAYEGAARVPASVTVKLPPARPATPSPAFDFSR